MATGQKKQMGITVAVTQDKKTPKAWINPLNALPPEPLLDAELFRARRAAHDLYTRSARGAVFYVMASVTFMLTIDKPSKLPWYAWVPPLLFTLFCLLRFINKVPADGATTPAYQAWRFRHWLVIDVGCLLWTGHLLFAGTLGLPYSLTLILALLCLIAYASVIGHMFAMDPRNAALALGCLCLPGTIAFAYVFDGGVPIAIGLSVYCSYALLMLDQSNKDYTSQIDTEHKLIRAQCETERLVATDSLTNLANRREYERRFAQAWNLAARQQGELALLVLDLDNFKALNDTYGHAAGDACLRHFAELLSQHFRRAVDLLARIGGEEFAVILPDITAAEAAAMGENFRAMLADSVCHYSGQPIRVTASIGAGAADWSRDATPEATFARIDQACYQAKRLGRSRLVAV